MVLDRKQCIQLYENAKCKGQADLFYSANREDACQAQGICAECPVAALCYSHVNPEEDGFTGTCAGRLYYDGEDVTDTPGVPQPPVFNVDDMNLLILWDLVTSPATAVWEGHTGSTMMAAFWALRRQRVTVNKLSKLSGTDRLQVEKLILCFDDSAEQDLKDFLS